MCGGGGGSSAPVAKYYSQDGNVYEDPNRAADRDRMLHLASAFGLNLNDPAYATAAPVAPTAPVRPAGGHDRDDVLAYKDANKTYKRAQQQYNQDKKAYDKNPNASKKGAYDAWIPTLAADKKLQFDEYNNQGLTAGDYRAETRLKDQEAQAKAAEDQRKASIAQSRGAVDTMMGSFDDEYYGNIGKTVLDYYLPQLQDQRDEADEALTFQLARQGLLNSTPGTERKAKLAADYDMQRGALTNRAADAERGARESVSATKSQLYNYADVAADPAAVNDRLAAETSRLRANAPELTPMGQVFSDYLTPIASFIGQGLSAERQGYRGFGTGLFSSGKNSSQSVVR